MDKHKAHDIVHTWNGGMAESCPVCKGEMTEAESKTEAKKLAADNYKPRVNPQIPYENRLMTYDDKEKKKKEEESQPMLRSIINVMEFSEKDSLPKKIKILSFGTVKSPVYGDVVINKKVIDDMIKNFDDDVRASSSKTGLPIDLEHGDTSFKKAAGGWMKKLFAEKDGLWAETEWTELGKDALNKKLYKFISPSFYLKGYEDPENGKAYENVLTGAGLVNQPGMPHSLPPIVNSEQNKNTLLTPEKNSNMLFVEVKKTMDVHSIAAKPKDQRSSEEQEFITSHKEDLTFAEAKKEGFGMDFKEAPKPESKPEVKTGEVTMSETEVKELKDKAEKGEKAFKELQRNESIKEIKKLVFVEGKGIKIAVSEVENLADLRLQLTGESLKSFDEHLRNLPVKEIFTEEGSDNAVNMSDNPGKVLDKLTKDRIAEAKKNGKELTYGEAQKEVSAEHPDLVKAGYQL